MDYIRRRFASLLPRKHPSELLKEKDEKLSDMIAKYRRTEDAEAKKALLDKIYAKFPNTLFLAAICFPEDNPSVPVKDRTLYASPGSKALFDEARSTVMYGNVYYKPSQKDSSKRMHLRTLVAKNSSESFIPLFTDFTKYTPFFGVQSRVALFTLREVKKMCQNNQGILINPGEDVLIIKPTDMWRIR